MYQPRHFTEERDDVVLGLVRTAGFGHLVVVGSDGLVSTPMPFVVDEELTSVRAHLARPNPAWRLAPCDALVIVPVTDAYVSPSWYPTKRETGEVVPTWNYEVVHLHGRLTAHDDPDWVRTQIAELTEVNEAAMPSPWAVDDAPDAYVAKLLRGIVGVEVEVSRVEAKRKLSQNKTDGDVAGAVAGLRSRGGDHSSGIADAMEAP